METYNACLATIPILLNNERWGLYLVNKVWVEDVEFISLYNLWRRVIMIVVSLVVFIPFISSMNTVKILRLSWSVLVMPPVHLINMATKLNFEGIKSKVKEHIQKEGIEKNL